MTIVTREWRTRGGKAVAVIGLAVVLTLAACGGSRATPTPPPTPTPTATATATATATPPRAATAARVTRTATAAPNPVAVTGAYVNLQKLDSYHLDVTVSGLNRLLPVGLGDTLIYRIDYYKGNQRVRLVDSAGATQEYLKIGNKTYQVANGQATELPTPPLLLTLPDLLYPTLTAPGVTTFTAAGEERVNDRATTRYNGSGQLAGLSTNPLLAAALAGASGEISGPVWIDRDAGFLVAGELKLTLSAPQPGTVTWRFDTTNVNDPQAQPIALP